MTKRCGTCRHWRRNDYGDYKDSIGVAFECGRHGDFCCTFHDDPKVVAGCIGGGSFVTRESFCCQVWESSN